MHFFREKNVNLFFVLLAAIFILLAIIGGIRSYSPVPLWDMWNGYLGFFTELSTGDVSSWWKQHNEHRIVLARVLFWIDITFFQGAGWFLIIVNYSLIVAVCTLFYFILKEQLNSEKENFTRKILSLLIVILLFSWIQKDNLSWGFQSQFILAQLLPLLSFFLLHKSFVSKNNSDYLFFFACLTGVLALGSMANGILTLPLMTLFAMILRMNWQRIAILIILAVCTTLLYFYDYHSPDGHGSILDALLNNQLGLIQFLLLYVGGPFSYLSGIGNQILAQLAGCFLIISSVLFAWRALSNPINSSLCLVMLVFILYIGGTAFGTGCGRLIFGLEQALNSRYQTPALMAWAALLVLYAPTISSLEKHYSKQIILVLIMIPLLLLPEQHKAIRSQQDKLFERWIAALALELGIKDQQQISSIFPSAEWALSIIKKPVENNLSIFGHPLIKDTRQLIGRYVENKSTVQCQGHLDNISHIDNVGKYIKIQGWLFQPYQNNSPESIYILNKDNQVIGYALTGQTRMDVAKVIDPKANNSGYKGYMLKVQGKKITLIGNNPNCKLNVKVPQMAYNILIKKEYEMDKNNVISAQSMKQNDWQGADWYTISKGNSTKPDIKIIGSFLYSDAESGSLTLTMKKGDRVWYRTEPKAIKQKIEIVGHKDYFTLKPTTSDWVLLEFSNNTLPDNFDVKFIDGGSGWGEWSAIAVMGD